jgi:predicted nucleic acid-binding protein
MSVVLLDTNIVSFILKGDSRALLYEPYLLNNEAAISLMTVAELFQWASVHKWGKQRTNELERYLLQSYTILAVDMLTSRLWGR